ncbi:unnamed protein product [Absidia cylindrospora]
MVPHIIDNSSLCVSSSQQSTQRRWLKNQYCLLNIPSGTRDEDLDLKQHAGWIFKSNNRKAVVIVEQIPWIRNPTVRSWCLATGEAHL